MVFWHKNYVTLKNRLIFVNVRWTANFFDNSSWLEITLEIWIVTLIMWDRSFVVNNKPQDSKLFLRTLVKVQVSPFATVCNILFSIFNFQFMYCCCSDLFRWSFCAVRCDSVLLIFKVSIFQQERQELGERVMVTRLHLFNKWVKVSPHYHVWKIFYGLCHIILNFLV